LKDNELKEMKLKYDVLKGKYDSEVYGRKTPKKMKDEKEEMKKEIEKLTQQVETLTQKAETLTQRAESLSRENKKYEEDIVSGKMREADLTKAEMELATIKKRSVIRVKKLCLQKKILSENEDKIRDLKSRLEVSEKKLATLEQENSELENLNSAVELELKTETDNLQSKVSILESEKAELDSR
jgi:chromosome segregation ATPase